MWREIELVTTSRCECVPLSPLLSEGLAGDGLLVVVCNHTTAGLTLNEGADPSVARDLLTALERLVPRHGDYAHAEGNSDAHVKGSLLGHSLLLPVVNGKLDTGTWGTPFFVESDGPRRRRVLAAFLPFSDG